MDKRTSMILMVIGGAFYIVGGAVAYFIVATVGGAVVGLTGNTNFAKQTTETMSTVVATGLISGALIIIGGVLVNSESRRNRIVGGVLGILGALIGIINTLAGLIVGLVLTLVGAIGGMTYKEQPPQRPTSLGAG